MSTQLRLLKAPKAETLASPGQVGDPAEAPRAVRAQVRPTTKASRRGRAAHWQEQWRLDDRTRRIGRAGIASARAALARAHGDDGDHGPLRRAS